MYYKCRIYQSASINIVAWINDPILGDKVFLTISAEQGRDPICSEWVIGEINYETKRPSLAGVIQR